jgi:membrane-associated phospholipid phosphatase
MRRPVLAVALLLASAAGPPVEAQAWLPSRREAAAGIALLGGALALDRAVDARVPEGGGTAFHGLTRVLNHGGRPGYAVIALGGTAAAGAAAGNDRLRDGAVRVAAGLLAAGVANGTLKVSLGRERPSTTDDPWRFRSPGRENRWQSFPSGHATVAFSLAAGLAEETGDRRVAALAYGAAAAVAWSRIYDDKHWTSDVVGGSLLGAAAGRGTVRLLRGSPAASLAAGPGGVTVRVVLR